MCANTISMDSASLGQHAEKNILRKSAQKIAVKVKNATLDILKYVGTTEKLVTVNSENGVCLNMKVMSTRIWKQQ